MDRKIFWFFVFGVFEISLAKFFDPIDQRIVCIRLMPVKNGLLLSNEGDLSVGSSEDKWLSTSLSKGRSISSSSNEHEKGELLLEKYYPKILPILLGTNRFYDPSINPWRSRRSRLNDRSRGRKFRGRKEGHRRGYRRGPQFPVGRGDPPGGAPRTGVGAGSRPLHSGGQAPAHGSHSQGPREGDTPDPIRQAQGPGRGATQNRGR